MVFLNGQWLWLGGGYQACYCRPYTSICLKFLKWTLQRSQSSSVDDQNSKHRAGEMARQLKACTLLEEDQIWFPGSRIGAHKSNFKPSGNLFWTPWASVLTFTYPRKDTHACTHAHTHAHTHKLTCKEM